MSIRGQSGGGSNQFKSMAYDHPSYTARQAAFQAAIAAGAAGTSTKFVAHAALLLFGLHCTLTAAGTSTYTATVTNTATVHIDADQLNLIQITNTNTTGTGAPTLATNTYGPFYGGDNVYANGTFTGAIGQYSNSPLNTNTGAAGFGGILVNEGDTLYLVRGTDATAASLVSLSYQIQPLANVDA